MFPVVMDPVEFELAHRRPLRRSLLGRVQKSRQRPYLLRAPRAGVRTSVRGVSGRSGRYVAGHRPLCNNAAAFSVATRTGPLGDRAVAPCWIAARLPGRATAR
ncbi:hypothetical protein GCM10009626_23220 [Brachybacterium sacelli]